MALSYREFFSSRRENTTGERKNIYGKIREYLDTEGVDKMILGVGDCRTGTTAWLAASARLGFPAYYQPGKAAMRCLRAGEEPERIKFAQPGKSVVVAKETIGPNGPLECTLNPVKTYSYHQFDHKGLDPSKLHVLFFIRNPVDILQSWKKIWGSGNRVSQIDERTLISNFVLSAKTEIEIYEQIQEKKISHTVYAQELLKPPEGITPATHSAAILKTIFDRAGNPITEEEAAYAVTGWPGKEYFKERIKFPKEPPYDFDWGLGPTLSSEGYHYVPQPQIADLTEEERDFFESASLIEFYHELLPVSAEHLQIEEYDHLYL